MSRIRILLLVLTALCVALPARADGLSRFNTAHYVGPHAQAAASNSEICDSDSAPLGSSVTNGCLFLLNPSDSFFMVFIQDEANVPVGGAWVLMDNGGNVFDSSSFCDSYQYNFTPDELGTVTRLVVRIDNTTEGPRDCGGSPGYGTVGQLVAQFG
ncbi:MAG: hypothetical protein ACYDAY_03685 [Candidatus Dormibacteria bacterium]